MRATCPGHLTVLDLFILTRRSHGIPRYASFFSGVSLVLQFIHSPFYPVFEHSQAIFAYFIIFRYRGVKQYSELNSSNISLQQSVHYAFLKSVSIVISGSNRICLFLASSFSSLVHGYTFLLPLEMYSCTILISFSFNNHILHYIYIYIYRVFHDFRA